MRIEEIYNLFLVYKKITTDSRNIEKGCMFFALKGDRFNGNEFAANAIEKGAAIAIIDQREYEIPGKTIVVKNVLKTLQNLAKLHRKKIGVKIIAITGSNGKTTTKELVTTVLSSSYNVVSTKGNLNNHIGVPLTLMRMNNDTDFGIVEMGANHQGEIQQLCEMADPDYGIITNIGRSHLEGFGSFEGVINEKASLFSYIMKKKGGVFYNNDNSILVQLIDDYKYKKSYGSMMADVIGTPIVSPPFVHAKVNFEKGILYINSQLTGIYNFENIMAAVSVGLFFNVDPLKIQAAIKNYVPQNNRSQLINKGRVKIIMDAYNANPSSMKASLESFVSDFKLPRYVILGDMLELGKFSLKEHEEIIQWLKNNSFTAVFLVGKEFCEAAKEYPFSKFKNYSQICDFLKQNPINEGALLLKGSRGMMLEKIIECI